MANNESASESDIASVRQPIPVVAAGGAAGSLDAFSDLLRYLPPTTGLAFIFIQHTDLIPPDQLVGMLSQTTAMPIIVAEQQQQVKPNRVYVLTADKDMSLIDGMLTFIPRRSRRGGSSPVIRMPIDEFFMSLAERQREGAIAILLSGSGNDGTSGLKAIKAAGGITFAQDETAAFQSMPKAAISEGVVDMVLPPVGIANELIRLSRQSTIFQQTAQTENELVEETSTNDEDLRKIILFLRRSIGVDFTHYKVTTVQRRIIRRMLLYKLDTLADYAQYLRQNPSEGQALYSDLLINVTNFFRDTDTMDYLKKVLFPQLIKHKSPRESIRIWVPACSTGEEPYSLAMLLMEILGEQATHIPINIFATDLSESAIARARLGTYTRSQMLDVSPKRIQRFFTKVDDHYRINKAIRDMCVFAPHNVFKDPPFSRLDLVSCRNMLIYTDNVLQRRAIATFHYALNPNGYLILGKSETVGTSTTLFAQIEKRFKVFVRKNDTISRATFDMNIQPGPIQANLERQLDVTPPTEVAITTMKTPNSAGSGGNNLDRVIDNILLTQYIPASVVVNQELEILQFRGSTGLFLEPAPGKASLNLLKMARTTLVFDLRNVIHKAQKAGQPVRKTGLEIKIKEQTHHVAIEAIPVTTDTDERLFLIVFEEVAPAIISETSIAQARNRRIKQLEDELANLREDMRSIIEEQEASNEELQSANEEIVSSNEELQSINEELETSKEEIESTNEELLTINQELQVRNDQLSEAYGYSEAIFATIREATIVLDKDLRLKSANKAFYKTFRLQEDDVEGTLIYELDNRQWDIARLRHMLEDVFHNNSVIQNFEVTHHFSELGEKVLRFNACKVVQQQRQEAVLLAIEDVTESRRAQRLSEERETWFRNIANNAPMLIWVAGTDGRYNFLNQAWLAYTGRTLEDEIGQGSLQSIHPDDRVDYLATYHNQFSARQPFTAEYRLLRHTGDYHWMLESAQPTFSPDGNFTGYIGTCTDVHIQKETNQELDRRVQQRTAELEQAEQKAWATAQNLQAVLDSSPTRIAFLKAVYNEHHQIIDFRLAVCNEKFAQLLNQSASQLVDRPVHQLAQFLWLDKTIPILRQVRLTGDPYYEERYTSDEPDGEWMALSVTHFDDGVVVTGMDITALKQAEQKQNQLLDELQSSGDTLENLSALRQHIKDRGEFLRRTSHDLRGNFGIIQGAATMLDIASDDDERIQMLSMLQRNIKQATNMLTELLDVARLEAGQEQRQLELFDAADMLIELVESVRPLANEQGLWLRVEGKRPLLVEGDVIKLRRIAQNLLLNALRYTQSGGVTMRWESVEDDGRWQFSVLDTGPGIDIDQANLSVNSDQRGEGIGLSIVRQLSELLDGTITVASEPGGGTLFILSFPVAYSPV
ncbi:CheR family methyltransferase [Spirosoma pomorum]